MNKYQLGWSSHWSSLLPNADPSSIVRITARHKNAYSAITLAGQQLNCYLTGRLLYATEMSAELPAVGDWCRVGAHFIDERNEPGAFIENLLPRKSRLSRKAAGAANPEEQVLAANVDFVFVVMSANRDFSINRLRRYVVMAQHGGVQPVVVLSKIDLLDDQAVVAQCRKEIQISFPGILFFASSVLDSDCANTIGGMLALECQTAVFVGSSGVGKSTLANRLLAKEHQKTANIGEHNQRGRHTTSSGSMFFLPGGGVIIDTPGLREVGLIADLDDLNEIMPEVGELAQNCRFADCTHATEPGCAVLIALESGSLAHNEYENYNKLEREVAYNRRKLDNRLASEERKRWKRIAVDQRRNYKERDRGFGR